MIATITKEFGQLDKATKITILVAALGYFVDIFDLLLFSIVRVQSLKDLGVAEADILSSGILLINMQMGGLLLGGILWGIWGDRMGRVSVLFGSILLYSLANIANGFVHSVELYAGLRFIAGIGLAGELGAGVTLASELLPRAWRGLGTTFIAAIGVLGATFAAVIAELTDWRIAYVIGGIMGLILLIMRVNVRESALYQKVTEKTGCGDIRIILFNPRRLSRYLAVILIGAPIWAVVGLPVTFAPEFAKDFGMEILPKAGTAVLACYAGISLGDVLSGGLSQFLQSRKKSVMISLSFTIMAVMLYIFIPNKTVEAYYMLCFIMGIGIGYWAMFVQMGAEQFGTNIRATAATTVPNMVRGLVIPMTAGFHALIPHLGVTNAGITVMGIMIALAFISAFSLRETFDADLDYTEN